MQDTVARCYYSFYRAISPAEVFNLVYFMGKRIEYIDAAKALGIIAVIVGHCFWRTSIPYLVPFIYSFHMPMFFMISGMFINENSLSISFKRNARNYLIPYLFGCAIQLMAVLVVSYRTR